MGERDYYLLHINIMKCFESPITTCSPSPIYQRNYSNLILIVVFLEAQLIAWLRLMLATLYGKLIWLIFHGGKWEVWVVVKIMLSAIFIGISSSSSWNVFEMTRDRVESSSWIFVFIHDITQNTFLNFRLENFSISRIFHFSLERASISLTSGELNDQNNVSRRPPKESWKCS